MPAFKVFILLLCLLPGMPLQAATDTVSVYFPFNQSAVTEEARQQLDKAIYHGSISDKYAIRIIGYADEVGSDSYNLQLSRRRAASVKEYLIRSGFRADRITLITGRGEAGAQTAAGLDGTPADRRVDIVRGAAPVAVPPAATDVEEHAPRDGPRKASATDIRKVPTGETLLLDKIYFFPGRHFFRPESGAALEALYEALLKNPEIRIKIEGHVCCTPPNIPDAMDDDTRKNELSINRALAVRQYLIRKGISKKRLEYAGYGRSKPIIDPETTEEEANKNRRVEIRVIK